MRIEDPFYTFGRRTAHFTTPPAQTFGSMEMYRQQDIASPPGSAGGASSELHPFKVVAGSEAGTVQVVATSILYGMLDETLSTISISGLASDLSPGDGDGIFLHGTVESGVVTGAEVEVATDDGVALAFDAGDFPEQTDFWVPIAIVNVTTEGDVTTVDIEQRAFTNYRLQNECSDSGPCIFAVPM